MSISPLSDRARNAILIPFVLCTGVASINMSIASGSVVGAQDASGIERKLHEVIRAREDFPDADPLIALSQASPIRLGADTEGFLIPFVVRYTSLSNQYCRLAVVDSKYGSIEVVELPPRADHDDCSSNKPIWFVDLNGDGRVDVVHGATIKSNRYQETVTEAVAYISVSGEGIRYCYAERLSSLLQPRDFASAKAIVSAVANAKDRYGARTLECASAPK